MAQLALGTGCDAGWGSVGACNQIAPGLSALLTAFPADIEPGGLPTAALLLRERRRSRGRGQAFSTAVANLTTTAAYSHVTTIVHGGAP